MASDGFQAADDTSDGTFTAPNHPPAVRIVTPQNNALFSGVQSIFLEGEGSDLEDGALAGANLGWESDVDGVLGNGALVMLNANALSEGEHKISLTGIDSGGLTHSDVITIRIFRVPPPPPASMTISADATSLVADGVSSTVIRVAVRDVNNDAVANYPVALATTLGNLTVPAATDATGVTTATLTSATTVGLATVSATAGSVAATVAVEFVRGAPATIALTADPTTLPADGSSTSTVTAVVSDSGGNLLPAQLVNFVTTLGTIPATATTDQDGVATVQLMAGGVGVATVTATSGAASNTVQVTVVGNTLSGAVFLDANGNGRKEPSEGGMAGVTVQLTATNGTALQSTTTDSNGSYRFLDLPAGAYVITIFVPTGYGATTSSSFPVTVSGTVGGEAAPDTGVAVLLYLPQIAR
ncbi:MAG: invasin domain 3-containing protein [Caldilineaceae bacterium]